MSSSYIFPHSWGLWVIDGAMISGKLSLTLIRTLKSGPCTSPGLHNKAESVQCLLDDPKDMPVRELDLTFYCCVVTWEREIYPL